jgi:hypothetical protein
VRAAFLAFAIWTVTVGAAHAHTMVTPYDLPISFGAYVWACVATLAVTFVVLTVMPAAPEARARREVTLWWVVPAVGRVAAVTLLVLTIVAGLFGSPSPVANIAPALFWVGLMLCLAVATALIGDVFQIIHPFEALLRWSRVGDKPRRPYPDRMAAWPAFVCYIALAWLELMAPPDPSFLAGALLAYAAFTTAGAAMFGREIWFQRAELFGMFFRMTGKLASVAYRNDTSGWHVRRRPALSGLLEDPPSHISQLLFVLFMLAATTYDGVWQTSFWAGLYWTHLLDWLRPLWGDDMARAQAILGPGYWVWQRGGLIAAPFVYLAIYWAAMGAMARSTSLGSVRDRALRFAWSVIPIALAYMLAHSWTLLLTEIPVIPFLVTDPLGIGWNLLGLERLSAEPDSLNMGQVWHIEVALILAGHVASVCAAHMIARKAFITERVWFSELPLLALMMGYTFVGLAVLALPLALH